MLQGLPRLPSFPASHPLGPQPWICFLLPVSLHFLEFYILFYIITSDFTLCVASLSGYQPFVPVMCDHHHVGAMEKLTIFYEPTHLLVPPRL